MSRHKTQLDKKLRSYRSARLGSIFLAIISAAFLLLVVATGETDKDVIVPAYASTFV